MLRRSLLALTLLLAAGCQPDPAPDAPAPASPPPPAQASAEQSGWAGTYTYDDGERAYMLALGTSDAQVLEGTLEIRPAGADVIVYDVRAEPEGDRMPVTLTAHRNYEGETMPLGSTLFTLEGGAGEGSPNLVTRWDALKPATGAASGEAFERAGM